MKTKILLTLAIACAAFFIACKDDEEPGEDQLGQVLFYGEECENMFIPYVGYVGPYCGSAYKVTINGVTKTYIGKNYDVAPLCGTINENVSNFILPAGVYPFSWTRTSVLGSSSTSASSGTNMDIYSGESVVTVLSGNCTTLKWQ